MLKKTIGIILATVLMISAAACSPSQQSAPPASDSSADTAPQQPPSSAAPQRIALGTASVGGVYYVYGAGLAQLLTKHVEGLEVSAEVTGGAAVNVGLVDAGEVQLGLATDSTAVDAYNGVGWANGEKYENVRAIAPMYPTFLEIYAIKGNGITSIYDFNDKVYCAGTAGSSGDVISEVIMSTLGIKPKQKQHMSWTDAIGNMKDGLIDAGLDLAGSPHNARKELETTHDIEWIVLSEEDRDKLKKVGPYFNDGFIKAGVYKDLKEDYPTLMVYNDIIANKDLDADTVYNILKAVFENNAELVTSHATAKDTLAENIVNVSMPLHVGAIRYYEELGIKLSDHHYPPEYKK